MPVIMESRQPGAPKWYRHPIPIPEGSTSSFSSQRPELREVYVFGYRDFPGVWVARQGADIDNETVLGQLMGIGTQRLIVNLSDKEEDRGLDLVQDLRNGPCRLSVMLKGVQLDYRISVDPTPEDESMRQTVEVLVREKADMLLGMYGQIAVSGGHGAQLEAIMKEIIGSLTDHDLVHYWLKETCPCNTGGVFN